MVETKDQVNEILDKIERSQYNPSHPGFNMGFLTELRTINKYKDNKIADLEQSNADYIKVINEQKELIAKLEAQTIVLLKEKELLSERLVNDCNQLSYDIDRKQEKISQLEKENQEILEADKGYYEHIQALEKQIENQKETIEKLQNIENMYVKTLEKENETLKKEIESFKENTLKLEAQLYEED